MGWDHPVGVQDFEPLRHVVWRSFDAFPNFTLSLFNVKSLKTSFKLMFGSSKNSILTSVFVMIFCGVSFAGNKNAPPFAPQKFEKIELRLDGVIDDDIWAQSTPITNWYRLKPDEGAAPSQKTIMRLAYDRDAVYLAAEVFENNADAVLTRSLERDSYSNDQDGVCILLDAYNDNRTAVGFIVTPAGVRTDVTVANDAEGGRGYDEEWDAFWDAAVAKNDDGWSAEIRIPFTSLRFVTRNNSVEMGLILWRYYARNSEYNVFPEIPNTWQASAFKPSQALDIRFEGVRSRNPIYLKPYTLGGINQINLPNLDTTAYSFNRDWKRDVGFDLKYNLTSNITLDITANTDFAQVEVDDQQINTTRFSLFFPEKRDFFQERANLFVFRFPGGPHRLFQSRRIGIVDGKQTPILGGVRLTGRAGKWEVGAIEMQTGETVIEGDKFASENFGVLRVRREAFESGSFIGGMATTRTDFDGNHNVALALDSDVRFVGSQYIRVLLAQTLQDSVDAGRSKYGAIVLQRRLRKGYSYGFSLSHFGPDFNPAVGFLPRRGINRIGMRNQYTWFPISQSKVHSHNITHRGSSVWGNDVSKNLETFDHSLMWSTTFKSGARAGGGVGYRYEYLAESFSFGEILIEQGDYNFVMGRASLDSPSGGALQYRVEASVGGYWSGKRYNFEASPSMTFSENISLGLEYEFNRIEVDDVKFQAHLTRARLISAFSKALSINAFVQLNSEDQALGANVRLRYNPREGNDFYLVYNSSFNLETDPLDPRHARLPTTQTRTFLLKYAYTFVR